MAEVTIDGGTLVVRVRGMDKVWALKSELQIPLEHVAGAERDEEEAQHWYHGMKMPGANIPGVITAGTFYQHGERAFWDVHQPESAVAIRLHDESYGRLVVGVDDPDATVAMVNRATGTDGVAVGEGAGA